MRMIEFTKTGGGGCAMMIDKIVRLNPIASHSRLTNIILLNGDIVSVVGTVSEVRNQIESAGE